MNAKRAALTLLLAGMVSSLRADLRVVGSDLLGVEFSKALYAHAAEQRLVLALALDGSRPGLVELQSGRADAALLVIAPEHEAALASYDALTLAYHRVVVLVPRACPLEQLTLDQVAAIFGSGAATAPTRWGQLNVPGEWGGAPIVAAAPEVGTGFALEYFRYALLAGRSLRATVARYRDATELARSFSGENRTIAIASAMPPDGVPAKALALAARAKEPAFLPTAENVHSGDYPLRLPLRLVYARARAAAVRPLLRYLLSDPAAVQFEAAGVVPLPPAIRARQLLALAEK